MKTTNNISNLVRTITGNVNCNETELTNKVRDMIEETFGWKSEQFRLIDRIDMDSQSNVVTNTFKSLVSKKDIKRLIQITK
jgi:predicted GTPase